MASIFYIKSGSTVNSENNIDGIGIIFAMPILFVAFNLIEPLIQSMVSKIAKVNERGIALGYVNSMAYIGTFLGGSGAGLALTFNRIDLIGYTILVISLIWIIWTIFIKNPIKKGNLYLNYSVELENKIFSKNYKFIDEWYVNKNENILVLKFNAEIYNEQDIRKEIEK